MIRSPAPDDRLRALPSGHGKLRVDTGADHLRLRYRLFPHWELATVTVAAYDDPDA